MCRHERKEWRDAGASTCQETIDDNCDIHRLWTSNSHVDCQSTLQGTYCHLLTNLTPRNFLIPNFDPLKSFGPSQDFHCCWLHVWSADDVTYQFLNRCCDSGPASLVNGARRYKRKCPEWSRAENQQLAGTTVLLLWNVHTQKEQFECANSWSFIPIWPLDLRPLETWTTAEPWFLIADDTQWTALVRDPTETIKTGSMSTVSIQHDCTEFIRQLIRRIGGVGAWKDRPRREEGRTCSFNSKKSHESSFGSSCNWDFKLRPDYGDCQGGRAETNLHAVSLMVKIVIIKKWEYVGSFFLGDDCTRHFSAFVSHLRCQKLSAQQSADAITLCVSGRLEIQRHH